ncbi:hypothetical protein [Rubinisphaera margarita]|uniref:hypothetical protein n=1 Tax=Rubinisphaera margarita TaxID=2909586 RepID=UPI001EE78E4F|nr:hypothetical protein [Rubinisphaera margarita]MCG6157628.1 hypothetical protein [Rubinisphaera margarita]
MTNTKYTISAANRITGKSRTTITKHIRAGRLSVTQDDQGNKLIDAAELIRVYGDDCNFDREEKSTDQTSAGHSTGNSSLEVQQLKDQLARETTERERERQQYREQIEHLQETLKRAQEGQNSVTRLLENQKQGRGDWEEAIKTIEKRLANQEQATKAELESLKAAANKKLMRYRDALEKERNKSFWQRLWS